MLDYHLLLCTTLSFVPVAQRKSSHRHHRFNVGSLKNTNFVSKFIDYIELMMLMG